MFKKGFSTIELLSVISTVAVLSTVGLPVLEQLKASALELKVNGELNRLQPVVEKYYTRYGKYPEQLSQKQLLKLGDVYEVKLRDPFSGEEYRIETFASDQNKKYYVLYSTGQNGSAELIYTANRIINNGDDIFVTNLPETDS